MANATVDQLMSALSRVDVASTKIGTGVQGAADRINSLKQELADAIANGVPVSELQPIVDGLGAEATTLEAHAEALAPLAHDVTDPVPVPVPEPEPPVEEPPVEPFPA